MAAPAALPQAASSCYLASPCPSQSFELPKAIHLESECFTVDNELMTPTSELRRTQLLRKYEPQVGAFVLLLKTVSFPPACIGREAALSR